MCTVSADVIAQLEATCGRIVVGTKPEGAPCTQSAQCAAPAGATAVCPLTDIGGGVPATGGSSSGTPQQTCQIVMPPVHAKAGDPCNSTCTTPPAAGSGSSGSSGTCEGIASSSGGAGGAAGMSPTGTCYTGDGVACDYMSFTCKPLVGAGQACSSSSGCSEGNACVGNVCVAKPKAGEACGGSGVACASGLYCDPSQKCAAQKASGAACSSASSGECAGGFCSKGKCVAEGQIASSDICTGKSSSTPAGGTSGGGTAGSSGGTPKG